MPPPTTFTRQRILEAASALTAEQGIELVTARNVAARLSCSTAPLYAAFGSIEELKAAVIEQARAQLRSYTRRRYTDLPFLNQGTGLVLFAQEHPQLFRLLFLTGDVAGVTVPQVHAELIEDMRHDARFTELSASKRRLVLEKLWFVAIGMATLAHSGQLREHTPRAIANTLGEAGTTLIPAALAKLEKDR